MFLVRPATTKDMDTIHDMAGRLLVELGSYSRTSYPMPSISDLMSRVPGAISRGDPVLIGQRNYGGYEVEGLLLWMGHDDVPGLPTESLIAFGTYVTTFTRRRGLSKMLRAEGVRMAKDRGYVRIIGTVQAENQHGRQSLDSSWKEAYRVVVKEL